jgi:hypothetical protein
MPLSRGIRKTRGLARINESAVTMSPLDLTRRARERFSALTIEGTNGCRVWNGKRTKSGYGVFRISDRNYLAHRVAFLEANPGCSIPKKMHVAHSCHVRLCIEPTHLSIKTPKQNHREMVDAGRHWMRSRPENIARGDRNGSRTRPDVRPRGELHAEAKITENIVRAIRWSSLGASALARHFQVSPSLICAVRSRRNWSHVE